MGKQQAVFALALVFFSAVTAMASDSAPSMAPSGVEMASEGPSPLDFAEGPNAYDNVIGTVSGAATDAAPVGSPVSDTAFPDLTPAVPGPDSGVAALRATTIVGAVAVVVGSSFLY